MTPFEIRYKMHYLDKSNRKIAEFRDYFVFASTRIVYKPKPRNEFLVNTPNTSYVPSCCSEEPLTNCRQLWRATHKLQTAGFAFRRLSFIPNTDDAKKKTTSDDAPLIIHTQLHHGNPEPTAHQSDARIIWHFNPLYAELNPICHLLALLAHPVLHVSRVRVNVICRGFEHFGLRKL